MQLDGDPLDMCSLATLVALSCTSIPATQAIPGESGLLEDFEVQGDMSTGTPVVADAVPLFITVAKVMCNATASLHWVLDYVLRSVLKHAA